jgi:hypothetical protein
MLCSAQFNMSCSLFDIYFIIIIIYAYGVHWVLCVAFFKISLDPSHA